MKITLALLAVLAAAGATHANAAYYEDECYEAACLPFNGSNSYVAQKAVMIATGNSAQVGDTISLHRGVNCGEKFIVWTVNRTPVLNSSHLTQGNGICIIDW